MRPNRTLNPVWLLLGLAFLLATLPHGRFAHAQAPTNVSLIYFTADSGTDGVRLEWETGSELNTAGFRLERSQSGNFIPLDDIGFLPAVGSPTIGEIYTAVDETAVLNTTYTYRLIEVEGSGNTIILDEATITYTLTPTATPIPLGGGGQPTATQQPNAQATATPTTTATSIATATTAATGTPTTIIADRVTATATATIAPTRTPQPSATPAAQTNIQTNPTAATDAGSIGSGTGGVTIAQAQEPTQPANGYPAQPQTNATPVNGYPGPDAFPTPTPDTTAAPEADSGIDANNSGRDPAVIGGDSQPGQPAPTTAPGQPAPDVSSSDIVTGRLFLWGGFIVAFLIFIVAVIGAMALLTRQKQ